MKAIRKVFFEYVLNGVKILAVVLTLILWISALLVTSYVDDMSIQITLFRSNNLLASIGIGLLFTVVCCVIAAWVHKKLRYKDKAFAVIVMAWICVVGAVLILFGKSVPGGDAMSVYGIAESFARGDMAAIHPVDSYLSYYPHQVGLVAFLEVLFRVWNMLGIEQHAYHFIKGIYVILTCVTVYFGYRTVDKMWKNTFVNVLFLCFAAMNLPMLLYSSFVYGEVPAFAAFTVGLYCLMCFAEKGHLCLQGWLSVLFFVLSVMLRKNSLILVIAVCLVVLCEGLRQKKKIFVAAAVVYMVGAISILPVVQKGYEYRAGNTLSSGVTTLSYLAMGMQEGHGACGFYNGFNFNTYAQSGLNADIANEVSRKAIAERLQYFKENPQYMLDFYAEKHLAQWAHATYDSLQATISNFGGRSEFFHSLYEGELAKYYTGYCKVFQIVIFGGAFLFALLMLKKKQKTMLPGELSEGFWVYIGLVGVLGGFLFHMVWEASARYIYVYSLLMVPYAAWGIGYFHQKYSGKLKKVLDSKRKT